jgi:hypothetical protein
MTACSACKASIDPLEVFPGGVCLNCWAASPAGRKMVTAEELIAMWGGRS